MIFNFDNTYINLPGALYSLIKPHKIENPKLLLLNRDLLKSLDVTITEDLIEILSGNKLLNNSFSQAYAGHQFGYFTILGDGRAVILGEHLTDGGKRYDIQLKGSGKTPYSRGGDGKATVGAMLREYIFSEALTGLNIKSSKSLAVILTNEKVYRQKAEDGAILIRVMKSHIRIGTFEYVKNICSKQELIDFTDYVIDRLYPEISDLPDKYIIFFESVMDKLIEMIINWLRTGFIHGVMNTDNMNITGETFDYGPCAFINRYIPETVFSSIDSDGRYSFKNQRSVLLWNLARFGEAITPIIDEDENKAINRLNAILKTYDKKFNEKYYNMMKGKLGIKEHKQCNEIIDEFMEWLNNSGADYTNTFIELMERSSFNDEIYFSEDFLNIKEKLSVIGLDKEIMHKNNPYYILRNYWVEQAIEVYMERGSLDIFNELCHVIKTPYKYNEKYKKYQKPPEKIYDLEYKTFCNT